MSVFNHTDYRDLVLELLEKKGRGSKVKLAAALNCQPGHVSQVLNKNKVHFSPENIIKISNFLKLPLDQEEYLLNLFYKERAGSKELREYHEVKMRKMQSENLTFAKQLKRRNTELDEVSISTYYSHWSYCCIHMLVSIPEFNTVDNIARKLNLSKSMVTKVLNFLVDKELISKNQEKHSVGEARIHLKKDSPLIKCHHQNFRVKAINSLEAENDFDLHYSSVMTLSKDDILKIRNLILEFISKKDVILLPSLNEDIICMNLDLFKF